MSVKDYARETGVCSHCGKPIYRVEEGWIHDWHRWDGDNGYRCVENGNEHATPKKEEVTA